MNLNPLLAVDFIEREWEGTIIPALSNYIKIPCLSPAFDKEWKAHGHMDHAFRLVCDWGQWCRAHGLNTMRFEMKEIEGRTPVLFAELPATDGSDRTVLLYGHLDKQPECGAWREYLGPWTPVRDGDKLYGRGGADDGYAVFAAMTALRALHEQGVPHARCVILIEASEESGSPDLPAHLEALKDEIGTPDLVICLDSSCKDYDHLWLTTSLRGIIMAELRVDTLTQAVHSGSFGGIAESSFMILCKKCVALEDWMRSSFQHAPPEQRIKEGRDVADMLGASMFGGLPWLEGHNPMDDTVMSGQLARDFVIGSTWMYSFEGTGIDGMPPMDKAANVIHPYTRVMLSMRVPPLDDPEYAVAEMRKCLGLLRTVNAQITFTPKMMVKGWSAPPLEPWLTQSLETASNEFFYNPPLSTGEGGTIPFNGMLAEKFPKAQFVVTGVLGPESNAHGPNEFLHIPTAKKITAAIAMVIADHSKAGR